MTEFAAMPAITVLCYLMAELYKAIFNEKKYKYIPIICGMVGMILGVVSYIWLPGYIPAGNIMESAAIGAASGWAATAANQTLRQLNQ